MQNLNFAVVGYGCRGTSLTNQILLKMDGVRVTGICDVYPDRVEKGQADAEAVQGTRPYGSVDYIDVLTKSAPDAVLVATSWETHVEIAIDALRMGVPVALEVGGAYNLESLWELVRAQEETGVPLMFLENCCFGKTELMATSMVRRGLLGEIVHCHGAYAHYLAEEIAGGEINRHYRLRNYLNRNCENYPTHELGPIAKVLGINRGNRMLSLVSVASKAAGMEDYINRNAEKYPDLVGKKFLQGDVVNTLITCADGSTISLRLDTTLPRSYAREFTLHGTRGLYEQNTNTVYLYGEREYFDTNKFYRLNIDNGTQYEDTYLPRVWKEISEAALASGHGGMDGVEFEIYCDALRKGKEMPIDVYDAAAWMSVSALSEQSIRLGGTPQNIPDFTRGAWRSRPLTDVLPLN